MKSLLNVAIYNDHHRFSKTDKEAKRKALTLFRMDIFGPAHGWGGKKALLPKICHTYPAMMKLDTVTPYLKKIQKIYQSRDTHPKFC